MSTIIFRGRLGLDAEVKKSAKGTDYLSMRIAVNEFYRGENKTVWYSVIVMADRVGKMKFTKGTHVEVVGDLFPTPYLTKSGEPAVSLDVMADRISYVTTGTGSNETTTTVTETTADTGKFEKVKPSKEEEVAVPVTDTADDLPF